MHREFLDFDAVELVDVDLNDSGDVERLLAAVVQCAQHLQFEAAQFAVRDHQEIAAAACRVEKFQTGELGVEGLQVLRAAFDGVSDFIELSAQFVEEQRADQFQQLLLGLTNTKRISHFDQVEQIQDYPEQVRKLLLSLTALRRVIKDYFMICDSYYDAIRNSTPSQIEAIDMGRRGLHNEGSQVLTERLAEKAEVDFDTARRLFTLVCALHARS